MSATGCLAVLAAILCKTLKGDKLSKKNDISLQEQGEGEGKGDDTFAPGGGGKGRIRGEAR